MAEPPIYPGVKLGRHGKPDEHMWYFMCSFTRTRIEAGFGIPGSVLDRTTPQDNKIYGRFMDICCCYSWAIHEYEHNRTMSDEMFRDVLVYLERVFGDHIPLTPPVSKLKAHGGTWSTAEWKAEYENKSLTFFLTSLHHLSSARDEYHQRQRNPRLHIPIKQLRMSACEDVDVVSTNLGEALDLAIETSTQQHSQLPPADVTEIPSMSKVPEVATFSSSPSSKRKVTNMDTDVRMSAAKKQRPTPVVQSFDEFLNSSAKQPSAHKKKSVDGAAPKQKKPKKAVQPEDDQMRAAREAYESVKQKHKLASVSSSSSSSSLSAGPKKGSKKAAAAAAAAPAQNGLSKPLQPKKASKINVRKAGSKQAEISSHDVFADLGKLLYNENFAPGVNTAFLGVITSKNELVLSSLSGNFRVSVPLSQ